MPELVPRIVKSHCNECLRETRHHVIAERAQVSGGGPEDTDPWEELLYQMVECCGCETISLRRTWTAQGLPEPEVDCFPPAASRRLPEWIGYLPWRPFSPVADCRGLLKEVYSAIHAGSYCLAMMGTRAIVDLALTDKLGDIGGFEQKLRAAMDKGWISAVHYQTLKAAIDAGNAASHRAYKPDKNQVNLVLDVVENFLQSLYVLEDKATWIAKTTPTRQKTKIEAPKPLTKPPAPSPPRQLPPMPQ